MPYGPRVINASGDRAEGDKFFEQSVFNGVSGTLSIGMPLFKDLTDAAEFNSKLATTALVTTPPTPRTGGRAVLATSAQTNTFAFMGIYAPENPGDRPNQGDLVRLLVYGEGLVAVNSPAAGIATVVGTLLGVANTQPQAQPIAAVSPRVTIGVVLATNTGLTNGGAITGGGAAAAVPFLVNAFISQT